MQQCPKEAFAKLFNHVSTSFFLLLIFFHFTSILLSKLFIFFGGNPFYQRNQEGYEFTTFSDEEVEGEDGSELYEAKLVDDEKAHDLGVAANIVFDVGNYRDTFVRDSNDSNENSSYEDRTSSGESWESGETMGYSTPAVVESSNDEMVEEEEILAEDTDSSSDSEANGFFVPTSTFSIGGATTNRVMTSRLEASNDVIRPG